MAVLSFNAPWKHQETSGFLVYFRKYSKNPVPWMHLNMEHLSMIASCRCSWQPIETNSFHYSIYFKGSAPWKRQETSDFLMFFRKYRKNPVPWNGLNIFLTNMSVECWYSWLFRNRACFLVQTICTGSFNELKRYKK